MLLLALAIAAYLAFSPDLFNDGDTSWHLAAGRLILATQSVPYADPFSFTFRGSPWTAHEWLAEALMAAAFAWGSWGGLALLFSAAVGLLLLMLGNELQRWLPARRAAAVLLVIFMMLAPFILARPHVLAWPLLAGWTLLLMRARQGGRAPPLAAALLMVLWANLHGSFIAGLLLAGFFALEAVVQEKDRRAAFIGWAVFGTASLLLSLLTPHGLEGLLFPLEVSGMESLPLIMEWRRVDPAKDWLFLLVLAAAALLLMFRRPRISAVRLILLAVLTYLALAHVRHQPLLAVVGTLVLARPLSRRRDDLEPGERRRAELLPLAGLFFVGMFVIAAVRLSVFAARQDSASNPITAIARLPSRLRSEPVINSYGFGGPLIFEGIRPFIDGRADMYGDRFMLEHHAIMNGDLARFGQAVKRWDIRWTLLAPDAPLARKLDAHPGWRRLYADRWAVVHEARR